MVVVPFDIFSGIDPLYKGVAADGLVDDLSSLYSSLYLLEVVLSSTVQQ